MRTFGKNRALELLKLAARAAGAALLLLLVLISVRAAWGMYQKFADASEARHAAESELETLKEKKQEIEVSAAALSSERGIEAEIRNRFGVAKAGEGEIRIVRDEGGGAEESMRSQGLWGWIVETFFVW